MFSTRIFIGATAVSLAQIISADSYLKIEYQARSSNFDEKARNIFDKGSKDSEFWLSFLEKQPYRVARPEDFAIAGNINERDNPDLYRATSLPCIPGDFNGDKAGDRACIVVNKNQKSSRRFGVIIINGTTSEITGRSIDKLNPSLHWIKKREDLSSSVLSYTARGGLKIESSEPYKGRKVYDISWNSKQRSYTCKKIN